MARSVDWMEKWWTLSQQGEIESKESWGLKLDGDGIDIFFMGRGQEDPMQKLLYHTCLGDVLHPSIDQKLKSFDNRLEE